MKKSLIAGNLILVLWIVLTQVWYYHQFAAFLTHMLARMLHIR